MLIGLDELDIGACGAVEHGDKVHLKAPVVRCERPRGHEVPLSAGYVELHLAELVRAAVVEKYVLTRGGGVAEAVADVPPERHAADMVGRAAPVPRVVISPHAAPPVEHGKAVRGVKFIKPRAVLHAALGAHTVYLLIIVEVTGLVERRADDHAVLRLVKKLNTRQQRALGTEIVHARGQHAPPAAVIFIADGVAFAAVAHIAVLRRFRHADGAERHERHRAFRDLPPLGKIEQGDRVQPHVAVVVHREGEGVAPVVDEIVIPFLYASFRSFHRLAAVNGEKRARPAGFGEVALRVEKGYRARYFMLHC